METTKIKTLMTLLFMATCSASPFALSATTDQAAKIARDQNCDDNFDFFMKKQQEAAPNNIYKQDYFNTLSQNSSLTRLGKYLAAKCPDRYTMGSHHETAEDPECGPPDRDWLKVHAPLYTLQTTVNLADDCVYLSYAESSIHTLSYYTETTHPDSMSQALGAEATSTSCAVYGKTGTVSYVCKHPSME